MPAVTNAVAALDSEAPRVWDEMASNVCFDWETGDACATQDALSDAAHVVELSLRNNRVVVAPMETRNALAWVDPRSGRRVLVSATQGAHWSRDVIARDVLGWDPATLELVTPRVGGSFGTKIFVYPEQVLVLLAAERLGAPVKWVASREEAFVSDTQGRDHHSRVRLGLDAQGHFMALQVETDANLGAFLSNYAPFNPTTCGTPVLTGAYRIGAFHARVRGVLTNTPPVDSYRGAGRPEATYVIERAIDAAALRMGIDKAELRRINLVGPTHLPYTTATGLRLETGLFLDNLERVLREADYTGFEARRRASAVEGRLRGFGIANYLEANGGMALARIMEPGGLPLESARIAFEEGGARLRVDVGTQSSGQGHRASYARVVANALAWDESLVSVHQGRTDRLAHGTGTGGSKSLLSGSTALLEACDAVVAKARLWVASHWGVSPDAVRWVDGCLEAGVRQARLEELVSDAAPSHSSSSAHPFDTEVSATVRSGTYGNGCHVCEVEVDPQTGFVQIVRYMCVNDFGELVSPRHVRAQVEGGVAQGLGQALYEECRFDVASGAMLATDFDRYQMVQAPQLPRMQVLFNQGSRGPNRLGVKGCGESGASGAPPAVINAVQDALAGAIGERALDVQMPATPTQIWSLLHTECPTP
jgi:carbon-monoxide dehydrogenase large subunit